MERFEVRCAVGIANLYIDVAMGEVFGGYCVVGPSTALTHANEVFDGLLLAFPELRQGYQDDPENYDPRIILVTPHGPDVGKRLVHLITVKDHLEVIHTRWCDLTDEVSRQVELGERLLRGAQAG
jgi:hypothetical protein